MHVGIILRRARGEVISLLRSFFEYTNKFASNSQQQVSGTIIIIAIPGLRPRVVVF